MSLVKKQDKEVDEDRDIDIASSEDEEITVPMKKKGHNSDSQVVSPSILGWKVPCPHCGEPFTVKYVHDGSYELAVES